MPVSAQDILRLSQIDCGIIAANEAVDDPNTNLLRLNNMVSGWRTQYGTVTAIERMIFPLVADQQTYTIGLGGDFDVPRPVTIDGAGLWLNGLASPASVTSITRSGYTATVTQTAHGYAVGDESFIDGATQIEYNGLQTVQSVPDADTYTFTVEGTPVTPATGTITAAAVEGTPVEIPRPLLTDDAYQAIQLKNMSNSQFTNVYYNPTYPYGTIYLWPRPSTAANQLVLYLKNVFGGFATLTKQYDWPEIPGYAEAIQYQLDLRLMIAYPQANPRAEIYQMANQAMGLIKRANNKLTDLPNEAAMIGGNSLRGGYNILTGGYN